MKHTFVHFLSIFFSFVASAQQYQLVPAFPNLPTFARALDLQHTPDGSNRLFVVQQRGLIYQFENNADVDSRKVFLDLSNRVSQTDNETGLLGLAFHPQFDQNGFIYVNYTATESGQLYSFVTRFTASGTNHDTVLRSTEKILLQLRQPAPNHNGGWIAFGPDGYLYTSFGDGGSGDDPWGNAKSKDTLFGKILRLDVDNGDPYGIPPTNPFATGGGRKEIYAYGLRNPWRCSFDPVTKKLWAGDVGQGKWEEVDTIINGGHYGWDIKEGYECHEPSSNCDSTGLVSPVWTYSHPGGISITGGYVYRGKAVGSLLGKYVYADLNGKVWALNYEGLALAENELLVNLGNNISSFGVDQNNELYVVSYGSASRIYKFVPESRVVADPMQALRISPNPANEVLQMFSLPIGSLQIQIQDIAGKAILMKEIENTRDAYEMDIRDIPSGTYFVVVSAKNGNTYNAKIVISR